MRRNSNNAKVKPYKWIKKEIEASNPYTEYEKIWRLSIEYGAGEFMQNLIYASTFSNFVANPWGAQVVWREDGGKVLHRATDRMHQMQYNNSIWWYYGPSHPETCKSVEAINKLHEHYAQRYPGNFSHMEDYLYVLCFTATSVDRFRKRLRLPGFSEKQKIAAFIFWREMSKLFYAENRVPLEGFPDDWEGMVRFCEKIENEHLMVTDEGHMIAEALFDQFAFRFFPRPLRPLGRAIPISVALPQTLRAHRIRPIKPILAHIIIFILGTFIWFAETFLPDPTVSYQELLRSRTAAEKAQHDKETRDLDARFPEYFASFHRSSAAMCPFSVASKKQT
ncbi:hypothetical protein M432DRAFT_621864 [Thermoascus aurantiacus ATCC 26904]